MRFTRSLFQDDLRVETAMLLQPDGASRTTNTHLTGSLRRRRWWNIQPPWKQISGEIVSE